MERSYINREGLCFPAYIECEHCDGVESTLVRRDTLRGHVCEVCDSALDEMFNEEES